LKIFHIPVLLTFPNVTSTNFYLKFDTKKPGMIQLLNDQLI